MKVNIEVSKGATFSAKMGDVPWSFHISPEFNLENSLDIQTVTPSKTLREIAKQLIEWADDHDNLRSL